jgi:4-hydroxythreonine-4-phosphate dehydrogenase
LICPRIAITAGEPAGIGPDLCLQFAQAEQQAEFIVIADPQLLAQRANELGLTIKLEQADLTVPASIAPKGVLRFIPINVETPVISGELNKVNAAYVLQTLQLALEGSLNNTFDAIVTGPVHKGVINDAHINFTGHTEFFSDGAGVDQVVMMLATSTLRVALATTHLPLVDVSKAITRTTLLRTIEIIDKSIKRYFKVKSPRIAVCGLNPHAGENGYLGREEIEVITPVIKQFSQQGMNVSGPWPADTVFIKEKLNDFDVVLAMYHDQGLPVLKHQGFGGAVNVTLGLPFIRTSVDHGTALDLAGTGRAKVSSLQSAADMAVIMSNSDKNINERE